MAALLNPMTPRSKDGLTALERDAGMSSAAAPPAAGERAPQNAYVSALAPWLLFPAALLALYLALPIVRLFAASSSGLARVLGDPEVRASLWLTFATAGAATALGVLLAVPLGYVLARGRFRGQGLLRALLDLPLVIPHPVVGIALVLMFARDAAAGRLLAALHLHFVSTALGITGAMLFVACPYLVHACRDGFRAVDPRLEGLARSLGHGPSAAFLRVSLPLARGHIVSGAILMLARAISEFGSLVILAYNPRVISVLIYDRFTTYGLAATLPLAGLVLLFGFAAIWAIGTLGDRRRAPGA